MILAERESNVFPMRDNLSVNLPEAIEGFEVFIPQYPKGTVGFTGNNYWSLQDQLDKILNAFDGNKPKLAVDMRGVEDMSEEIARVLNQAKARVEKTDGKMALVGATESVRGYFEENFYNFDYYDWEKRGNRKEVG